MPLTPQLLEVASKLVFPALLFAWSIYQWRHRTPVLKKAESVIRGDPDRNAVIVEDLRQQIEYLQDELSKCLDASRPNRPGGELSRKLPNEQEKTS